jgi:hypothetical protein
MQEALERRFTALMSTAAPLTTLTYQRAAMAQQRREAAPPQAGPGARDWHLSGPSCPLPSLGGPLGGAPSATGWGGSGASNGFHPGLPASAGALPRPLAPELAVSAVGRKVYPVVRVVPAGSASAATEAGAEAGPEAGGAPHPPQLQPGVAYTVEQAGEGGQGGAGPPHPRLPVLLPSGALGRSGGLVGEDPGSLPTAAAYSPGGSGGWAGGAEGGRVGPRAVGWGRGRSGGAAGGRVARVRPRACASAAPQPRWVGWVGWVGKWGLRSAGGWGTQGWVRTRACRHTCCTHNAHRHRVHPPAHRHRVHVPRSCAGPAAARTQAAMEAAAAAAEGPPRRTHASAAMVRAGPGRREMDPPPSPPPLPAPLPPLTH